MSSRGWFAVNRWEMDFRCRRLEAQQLLENALMAPVVPMPPPMDFASLDMPPPEKDQEWEEDDEEG